MRGGRKDAPKAITPPPDIFDNRTHRMARIAVPVVLALVYGYWAAANRRSGGPVTAWNLLFLFVTAVVFGVVFFAVLTIAPRLRRELHALLWAVFIGASFGFLYNQAGASLVRSVGIPLIVAAMTFIVFFYRFYTREDAAGHRVS
ncbi:hypothetical protein G3I21_14895 [Streptomyces bauhiniae]|uniref:Uncharacterized protein n=1 Tax=Streptomyces bauhiniae TaxID=2340725 RepID=A0A7K3QSS0_9ACTN|nr:hypothetical protein [Streptomyces bauhiniae]